jgi:hypothetical protein
MVEKMSTENRFSEDKDKPFAGACAATEWKIPSTKTISARTKGISEITYSSRAALKDELVYQLSSRIRMNWHTMEISHKYHERAKSVLYSALLHDSLGFQSIYADGYAIRLNMLYRVAFRKISFTMLGNFLAVTCSPNILLIDEKAVSAIHLCP